MKPDFLKKLLSWIASGNVHKFYVSPEWRAKSAEVLKIDRHECQLCKRKGRYRRADLVHHVNHVKRRPDLALDIYFGEDGQRKRNLISVCKECHETECHPERLRKPPEKPKYSNQERWD